MWIKIKIKNYIFYWKVKGEIEKKKQFNKKIHNKIQENENPNWYKKLKKKIDWRVKLKRKINVTKGLKK